MSHYHQYIKANNKYMKDYNKFKESSYLRFMDGEHPKIQL